MRSSRSAGKRLGIEKLENRDLMAGNVTASVRGGILEIMGDTVDNGVAVAYNATTQKFEVSGLATAGGATKINGFDTSVTGNVQSFGGVTHVRVRTGAGDDLVQLGTAANPNVDINGWLNIQTGAGNDTVIAGQAGGAVGGVDAVAMSVDVASHVAIYTDIGNDVIKLANFHTDRNMTINMAAGDDKFHMPTSVTLTGATSPTNFPVRVDGNFGLQMAAGQDEAEVLNLIAGGDLRIRDSSGVANIDVRSVSAGRTVEVSTWSQNDDILLDGVTAKYVAVSSGHGNDTVVLRNVSTRRLAVSLKSGNDKLTLGGVDVSQATWLDGSSGKDVLVQEAGNQLRGRIARSFG